MVELQAVELCFYLVYFFAVCVHIFLGTSPVLVDLLDDDFGVAVGKESLNAE
jgi:hypothetical protein